MNLDKSCKTCQFWNGEGCLECGVSFGVTDADKEKSCWRMSLEYFSEYKEKKSAQLVMS